MNDTDIALLDSLGEFAYDPLAWVYWAFPWGIEGGELSKETGPDEWQLDILRRIRDKIITPDEAIRIAVTSGHGVGKSALVAWLVWWAFSTFPGTRGVVTANTENQLKTKTWVEIAKWHRLFIAKHLFKVTATAIFSTDEAQSREWRIDIVPWSERNTEAFAGLHNAGKRLIIIFDEASAIPDLIWETTEGALTDKDTEIMWFCFGNPTRNSGRFRSCFAGGSFAHRWHQLEVDSRTVKRTNKAQLDQWVLDHGIDSDFVRVRILGKFPKQDADSFISFEAATAAVARPLDTKAQGPLILGVDVARFGDDMSVIWPRRGRDAFSLPIRVFSGIDLVHLSQHVVLAFNQLSADFIMVDETGLGAGVVDILRSLQLPVYGVNFGAKPDGFDPSARYANKRAEIWGQMRSWINSGGSIPGKIQDRSMVDDLCAPSYTINDKTGILLEPKSMIKSRLGYSPDFADALACTFGFPFLEGGKQIAHQRFNQDYDIYAILE